MLIIVSTGIDIYNGKLANMYEANVCELASGKLHAIACATEAAVNILRIGRVVTRPEALDPDAKQKRYPKFNSPIFIIAVLLVWRVSNGSHSEWHAVHHLRVDKHNSGLYERNNCFSYECDSQLILLIAVVSATKSVKCFI